MKFPTRNYLFFTGDRAASIFTLGEIALFHLFVLYVMRPWKMQNTIFCSARVLLLCVKYCLLPLHTCWEIDGFPRLRKIDWFLNGVSGIDFQLNVNLFHSVQSFISQSNRFS